ncbi:WD40/YVTN/BNR-like repeat-containing protein [Pseudomonas putida]|uniref:WD40/YVTN/BNR-like repeat-containing protein n=1 Tax=Pseudomonas putida TaxID=303 RepID=UPI0015755A02|nr:YCF48-related protein [Pseudomonas putida]NTY90352.1 BNR domain-containing protein [Pseudomonas putida]NTY98894.1 BNR domain-containing protein [Pseudomonas putida]NTZ21177.1 BNR domain-containing protein [Pseudomonas putida]NTZ53304.1 BNR domain-containing protein [Pseudomonas putida]NTZ65046.1 BNR domain-containing protein [Pseudomonas putida]
MNSLRQLGGVLLVLLLPAAPPCLAQDLPQSLKVGEVLASPATLIPSPQRAVYTALARAGDRIVAVGERGLIVCSDDNGQQWRQATVPVSVGLTAVQFADDRNGWAVGHSGVVLVTHDAGESWQLQLDGRRAAQLELAAAEREASNAVDSEAAGARLETAEHLIADALDKPLLALAVTDSKKVLVVGAYGLALRTDDGGVTWQSVMGQIDNPTGLHLYAVARQGDTWILAGEQGYLSRSRDGLHFQQLEMSYPGSLFTLAQRSDGAMLIGGLKGHAFVLPAGADTPEALPPLAPVTFSDALALRDGRVLLANQAGGLFASSPSSFKPVFEPLKKPISAVMENSDGSLVFAGFTGLSRIAQPAIAVSE